MNRPQALTRALLVVAGCLVCACQNTARERQEEVRRIAEAHDRYVRELEVIRADFQAQNPMPLRIEFGTGGTLILHECGIAGLPGSEKLRVRFSFLNLTGLPIERSEVVLTLIDNQNELEWSEIMDLELPFGLSLGHNSSYTSFFEMPLEGLHRRGDWDWRIELRSQRAPFPGTQAAR